MEWAETYNHLKKRNRVILLILTLISFFFTSTSLTLGVILGGVIAIINFDVLQRNVLRTFPSNDGAKVKKIFVIGIFFLRFLVLGAVIYLLIRLGWVNPVGLAAGLSTVVFSIISFGIHNAFKSVTGEAT